MADIHIPSGSFYLFTNKDLIKFRVGREVVSTLRVAKTTNNGLNLFLYNSSGLLRNIKHTARDTVTMGELKTLFGNDLRGYAFDICESQYKPRCPNGVEAIPEQPLVDNSKYIIWFASQSTENYSMSQIYDSEEAAKAAAESQSSRHGRKVYWAKLSGFVEQKTVTTSEITTL